MHEPQAEPTTLQHFVYVASFPGGRWNSLISRRKVEQPGMEGGRMHVPWLVSWTPVLPHHCTLTVWMGARERGKMVNIENGCLAATAVSA